jgi:hypothetical protein
MDLVPEYMKGFMDVWNEVEELRIAKGRVAQCHFLILNDETEKD